MKALTAYTRIAQKVDEQEPHTAPKAKDGSIHEAFIDHLKLLSPDRRAAVLTELSERAPPLRDDLVCGGRQYPPWSSRPSV